MVARVEGATCRPPGRRAGLPLMPIVLRGAAPLRAPPEGERAFFEILVPSRGPPGVPARASELHDQAYLTKDSKSPPCCAASNTPQKEARLRNEYGAGVKYRLPEIAAVANPVRPGPMAQGRPRPAGTWRFIRSNSGRRGGSGINNPAKGGIGALRRNTFRLPGCCFADWAVGPVRALRL